MWPPSPKCYPPCQIYIFFRETLFLTHVMKIVKRVVKRKMALDWKLKKGGTKRYFCPLEKNDMRNKISQHANLQVSCQNKKLSPFNSSRVSSHIPTLFTFYAWKIQPIFGLLFYMVVETQYLLFFLQCGAAVEKKNLHSWKTRSKHLLINVLSQRTISDMVKKKISDFGTSTGIQMIAFMPSTVRLSTCITRFKWLFLSPIFSQESITSRGKDDQDRCGPSCRGAPILLKITL